MAKFKIWMVALTLIMGVSMTSCFDDNDDGTRQDIIYGKCINFYPPTFQGLSGEKVILSGSSTVFNEGDVYFFYYQYNVNELVEGSIPTVTLYSGTEAVAISAKSSEGPVGQSAGTEGNAPFYTLTGSAQFPNGTVTPKPVLIFDNEYLLATPTYWVKAESVEEEQQKEFDKHAFIMTYDLESIQSGDTELVLTFNHVITETTEEAVERKNYTTSTKVYNLKYLMSAFAAKAGNKPTKIKVVAKTNNQKDSMEDSEEQVWESTIK